MMTVLRFLSVLSSLFFSLRGNYMAAEEEEEEEEEEAEKAESESRVAWRLCVDPRRLWF